MQAPGDARCFSVSKKWLCHFFEFFPSFSALRLHLCAAVCSGKEVISSKFLRKPPHMSLVFDQKSEGFGPPIPPRRFFDRLKHLAMTGASVCVHAISRHIPCSMLLQKRISCINACNKNCPDQNKMYDEPSDFPVFQQLLVQGLPGRCRYNHSPNPFEHQQEYPPPCI